MIHSDYHIHTSFSNDSLEFMENCINAAINKNLLDIAFTDHLEPDYKTGIINDENFSTYIEKFELLKKKYCDKIKIKLGAEVTLYNNNYTNFNNFTKKYDFDFIIGSQHAINRNNLYSGFDFDYYGKEKSHRLYLEELLENSQQNDFDVIAHFDFISRYSNFDDNELYLNDNLEIIDEIFKTIINRNKGIEVNLSAIRYGKNNLYPSKEILKRYKALDGKILTVGSDAHSNSAIGKNFKFAEKYILECGFKEITTFTKRVPSFYKI